MIFLFKLHWTFFARPTKCIKEHLPNLPVNLGLFVFFFYLIYNYFLSPQTFLGSFNFFVSTFGVNNIWIFVFYIFLSGLLTLTLYNKLMPIVVKNVLEIDDSDFEPEKYKKAVFYSPLSLVIYTVLVLIPLQLITSLLALFNNDGYTIITLSTLMIFFKTWSFFLLIGLFVFQWKAIRYFYDCSNLQTFLIVFVIPFLFSLPILLLMGPSAADYIHQYLQQ